MERQSYLLHGEERPFPSTFYLRKWLRSPIAKRRSLFWPISPSALIHISSPFKRDKRRLLHKLFARIRAGSDGISYSPILSLPRSSQLLCLSSLVHLCYTFIALIINNHGGNLWSYSRTNSCRLILAAIQTSILPQGR